MFRTHVRESGRRIALLVLVLTAAGGACRRPGALAAPAGTTHYPDLQTVIPTTAFSVVQGTDGREFRYTHLVFNAGPGPLEIQPQYNGAVGQLSGPAAALHPQRLQPVVARLERARARRLRLPRRARSLPLPAGRLRPLRGRARRRHRTRRSPSRPRTASASTTPTSTTTPSCTPGRSSGTRGSCADPTTLRGLTVGAADEYDYRDPGQAIPFDGRARRHLLVPRDDGPQQRLRRGQRGQQRDRREGDRSPGAR